MKRFRVAALPTVSGSLVHLEADDSHHLLVVCRYRRGASLVLFDGHGHELDAVLEGVQEGIAVARTTSVPRTVDAVAELRLLLAVPKGPALDRALRMAVEVGVTHVHLALGARSIQRADRSERWRRILRSACQQCGRADEPSLFPLRSLAEARSDIPPGLQRYLALPGAAKRAAGGRAACVAIGPEGGFTPAEVDAFLDLGWSPLSLGPWVLRSDTATAVALALLVGPTLEPPVKGAEG